MVDTTKSHPNDQDHWQLKRQRPAGALHGLQLHPRPQRAQGAAHSLGAVLRPAALIESLEDSIAIVRVHARAGVVDVEHEALSSS